MTCASFALFLAPVPVAADELLSSITRGGRLYDNWHREIRERPPATSHPSYPAGLVYSGVAETNWRCKECHGWDYRGRDGAYSTGPHATGIKGIQGMAGADPDKIVAVLKDAAHAYGGVMAAKDLADLANFVSKGQVDMDRYFDPATKTARGDKSGGEVYYNSICAGCHGRYGHKLRTIPHLGEFARTQPWETLHKILNGHPAEKMPSLRAFSYRTLVDILSYVQSLPDGETAASVVRGGRLYDDWRAEIKAFLVAEANPDFPANKKHPAYPVDKAFASKPRLNWRCKECHGWDYLGRDGAYSAGPHFTGIKGIRGMAGADPGVIMAILNDKNHRYGEVLAFEDILDLAHFVSKGQVDMNKHIDRASKRAIGDKTKHTAYYTTICAVCHGMDGTAIVTALPIGKVARHDPWEVLHKIVNGHPDEAMPALRVLGVDALADILAFVQSLPEER